MSNTTNTKRVGILNTQNNIENTHNSQSLISREPIEGTPFTIIGTEVGYFITLGDFRLSEQTPDKQELIDKITNKTWDLIIATIAAVIHVDKRLPQPEHRGEPIYVDEPATQKS